MLFWTDYYLRWWRLPIEERACRKTDLGGGDYYLRDSGLPPYLDLVIEKFQHFVAYGTVINYLPPGVYFLQITKPMSNIIRKNPVFFSRQILKETIKAPFHPFLSFRIVYVRTTAPVPNFKKRICTGGGGGWGKYVFANFNLVTPPPKFLPNLPLLSYFRRYTIPAMWPISTGSRHIIYLSLYLLKIYDLRHRRAEKRQSTKRERGGGHYPCALNTLLLSYP